MAKLSISKAWDDSRPIIAQDGKLMFAIALATVVLPGTLMYLVDPSQNVMSSDVAAAEPTFTTFLISFFGGLIGIIGSIAISYLALTRGASVGDALQRGLNRLLPTIGAVLLLIIPIVLFAVLFAIAVVGATSITAATTSPASLSPGALLLFLGLFVLAVYFAVRFMLMTPVIAAEDVGPLGILKRSWSITRGSVLRLLGFLILFVIAALIVLIAVGIVAGLAIALVFGAPEPMSLAALFTGLFATVVQAAFTIVYSTMVAQIYLQLTRDDAQREARVSVPPSL